MQNHLQKPCERLHALRNQMLELLSQLFSALGLEVCDLNFWGERDNSVVVRFLEDHLEVGQVVAGLEVVVYVFIEKAFSELSAEGFRVSVIDVEIDQIHILYRVNNYYALNSI